MSSAPAGLRQDVPLAPMTTFGIGGPARHFLAARSDEELQAALLWASAAGEPVFILGGGSNVLVADEGFAGLVVRVATRGQRWTDGDQTVRVEVAAGETWDDLVAAAVARGLSGIECLSGIPGTVGAAPVQNIGAYGQELRESLGCLTALDRVTLKPLTLANAECDLGYRTSRLKASEEGRRVVVLHVLLELRRTPPAPIRYAELERALSSLSAPPDVAAVRQAVLALRAAKSMLAGDGPLTRSAGSFFLNPALTAPECEAAEEAGRRCGALAAGESLPRHALPDGRLKLSAAWLIEHSGLPRGTRRGAVGLAERHALAIVNHGGATARDVLALAREVRARVQAGFGLTLQPEPVLVGSTWDSALRSG